VLEEVALTESTVQESAEAPLEVLVRAHTRLVFQITYSVLRNHHDAEDSTQETFLSIMRHHPNGVHDLRAWVARIAWRVAVDHRRNTPMLDDTEFEDAIEQVRSHCAGAEQIVIGTQMLGITERLIANLPSDLRAPLTLSTVEELTSVEIAAVLGIPEASVRTRLHRARRLLKEKLSSLLEGKAL
jgi:RNA polymerase sigma-70 factor (ECF subfamily)